MSKFILQHRTSEIVHSSLNEAISAIGNITDRVDGEIVISRYKTESDVIKSVIGVTDGSTWNIFSYDDDIIDEKIAAIVAGGDIDLSGYLKKVDFNSYSGTTHNAINQRLLTSEFNTYKTTVTTELGKKVDKTTYETYTGETNTLIQSKADTEYVNKTFVNSGALDGENILLKDVSGKVLSTIKLSDIIQKGMVESVVITDGTGENEGKKVLLITWNTEADTDPTEIPLEDIFNPDNYYNKDEVDAKSVFFETYEEYESAPKEDGVTYYVGDAKIISRNGEEFQSMGWAKFMDVEEEYMPIAVYNDATEEIEVYLGSEMEDMNDVSKLTPIGVVVIPKEHNVYGGSPMAASDDDEVSAYDDGDGACAVMSLVNMSWKTPDVGDVGMTIGEGGDDGYILYFGNSGYTSGTTYSEYPILGTYSGGTIHSTIQGYQKNTVHIPSDFSTGLPSITDPYGKYYGTYKDNRSYGVSPYDGYDEERNLMYSTKSLSYYNGKENTEKILSLVSGESWKTSESLDNDVTVGKYPTACACWRFSTAGTNQGDWYLPSIAEAGYVIARFKKINDTLEYINKKFNHNYTTQIDMGSVNNMWTSSPIDSNSMACASTMTQSIASRSPMAVGSETQNLGKYGSSARAFLKITY